MPANLTKLNLETRAQYGDIHSAADLILGRISFNSGRTRLPSEHSERIRQAVEAVHGKAALKALIEWHARQERDEHPDGEFDDARRFYPNDSEYCECCRFIRRPTRNLPMSLMMHCRSLEHISNLYGLTPEDVECAAYGVIREWVNVNYGEPKETPEVA